MSRWPGNAQRERTTFGGLSRGQLMSRVRSTGNQTTEERLARLLRRAGLSGWRRHQSLPGLPDFVWPRFKVAVFADGCFLPKPTVAEVASKMGLKTRAEQPFYDLVVVGAGPAGLAAAVYGAADGLRTLRFHGEPLPVPMKTRLRSGS